MKKRKKILLFFLLLFLFAVIVVTVYRIYPVLQKTPDEIVEIERQKTQTAYKENLDAALASVHQYEFVVVLNPASEYVDREVEADSHTLVWPIPSYELKITPSLQQNPGYSAQ